jgi:NADPH2:quinone reductase
VISLRDRIAVMDDPAEIGDETSPVIYPGSHDFEILANTLSASDGRMLAACYPTAGEAPGTLSVAEIARPQPAPGEVLVRVRVSGVNPTDWKSRRSGGNASVAEVVVPNQDGAGEIVAVGDGVDAARVGERVWLWEGQWQRPQGTAAQWIALPAHQAVALPPSISHELGAGLGIPAITAHRCLFADGSLSGAKVLVHGGAGAVGHAAIELALWHGAHVATTVSSEEKADLARAAGAELVINYRSEMVADLLHEWAPDGVARIVEVNLAANVALDTDVLADGGVITCYTAPDRTVELSRSLMVLNARLAFVLVYTIPLEAKLAAVADISQALSDGALTALPEHRFTLGQIAAAHDAVQQGAIGKVLVEIP